MIPSFDRVTDQPISARTIQQPGAEVTELLVAHLGYLGIALILVLGGLGLPIPEEAPIILAAVLSRNGRMLVPLAFSTCLAGVLLGDFVVYFLGYYHGEKVLSLPVTRRLLTRAREAQIKGYFHRHGFKILVFGRFAVGFRTAAYLTAGILQLPPLKLFLTDLVAASLSTLLMFGLGYAFAQQIQSGIKEVQQVLTVTLAASIALLLAYRYYKGRQRAGLPVGPPVLFGDDLPLPPDDLESHPDQPEGKSVVAEFDSLVAAKASTSAPRPSPRRSHAAPNEHPASDPSSRAPASVSTTTPSRPPSAEDTVPHRHASGQGAPIDPTLIGVAAQPPQAPARS
jgi:membrane protein DedA with SNARE-associated domain